MANIALISLGCAKNQVNSEEMLYLLVKAGHTTVGEPQGADAVVVNTCGFIDSAKGEAIDHILELGELKRRGDLKKIIVTGCLSQRYGEDVLQEMPEVDAILGTGSYGEIVHALERVLQGERVAIFGDIDAPLEDRERIVVHSPGWAYLKIAEGCDNRCAYCVIPSLRGKFRSRPMENLLAEARRLAADGVRELILVAQDITQYGMDLDGTRQLPDLIAKLAEIPELKWIRLHYLYPDGIDDRLIAAIRDTEKVVHYLDIPIQHINDNILTAMNRRGSGAEIRALFAKLRAALPGLVLRTSLIVGLPGEGEAELTELAVFLQETGIQRVGVFPYSPQDETPAAQMPDRPALEEAERRAEALMAIQVRVMDRVNKGRIGREEWVLCEGYDPDRELHYGRSYAESPDIDGAIWIQAEEDLIPGQFYRVRYTGEVDGEMLSVLCDTEEESQ